MKHAMLDLETLDTNITAAVTAIGVCLFDEYGLSNETFYMKLGSWEEQQKRGRTIDGNTVAWWLEQSREAQQEMLLEQVRPEFALHKFQEFLAEVDPDIPIWGNGVDFDNAILKSMYKDYGLAAPWGFRNNRCYRTINALKPRAVVLPERQGVHHNALHDAEHQARCLIEITKHMGIQL